MLRKLGEGGMGTVWLGEKLAGGQLVALNHACRAAKVRAPGGFHRTEQESDVRGQMKYH